MSSFFTIPAAQKKRKRREAADAPKKRVAATPRTIDSARAPPRKPARDDDVSISGSDDEDDDGPRSADESGEEDDTSGSEGEGETAAERRLRLAERYLENIQEEVDDYGFDAADIDRDLIAERLQEDAAEAKGRLYQRIASQLSFREASHTVFRANTEAVTAVALCLPHAYTVSKDLYLIKWRLQDLPKDQFPPRRKRKSAKPTPPPRRRPTQEGIVRGNAAKAKESSFQGHVDDILCVAASQDGKFVATGGRDRRLIVWDASTLKPLKVFTQHRDAVTGLAFRRGTNQLYSSSKDRTVKVWSLNELAYVETLFGHQDEVVDIAALAQERCVSVGARDRTARLWKVVEETQLVFRGGGGGEKKSKSSTSTVLEGSMDRVAMIDEEMFVTGSDNGSLSLWSIHKKKPVFVVPLAHGVDPPLQATDVSAETHPGPDIIPMPQPRWITALTTVPYSDVILSGSWDGFVRAWRVSADKRSVEQMAAVAVSQQQDETADEAHLAAARGVVNDLAVMERGERAKEGLCIVAALGKEHRLGRWQKVKGKNGAVVFEVARIPKANTNGVHKE